MDELQILRNDIDLLNKSITELFIKRMGVAKKIGDIKISQGKAIYDRKREEEMLQEVLSTTPPEMSEYVLAFFKELIRLSREYQENK